MDAFSEDEDYLDLNDYIKKEIEQLKANQNSNSFASFDSENLKYQGSGVSLRSCEKKEGASFLNDFHSKLNLEDSCSQINSEQFHTASSAITEKEDQAKPISIRVLSNHTSSDTTVYSLKPKSQCPNDFPKKVSAHKKSLSGESDKPNKKKRNSIKSNDTNSQSTIVEKNAKILEKEITKSNFTITAEHLLIFKGGFNKLICTQVGSRCLQASFQNSKVDILDTLVTSEILSELNSLLIDKYGNYTCQKLYQHISKEVKLKFINSIDFFQISTNETGTYPLQSIVEFASTLEEKSLIILKYSPFFKEISLNKFGNHIIEKSLMTNEFEKVMIFFGTIIADFMQFACDQFGVKIIKFFATRVVVYPAHQAEFESTLLINIKALINHEFGNYLVQSVVENWDVACCSRIMSIFEKELVSLSISKYSSNVLEKMIERLENKIVDPLLEEIESSDNLNDLLKSHYLLFVVQRMLNYLSRSKAERLMSLLHKHVIKQKETKINITRWIAFLEKNSEVSKQQVRQSAKGSNKTSSDSNLYYKPILSPELMPSKMLSPPMNPYVNSHYGLFNRFPASPALVSNPSNNQFNMLKNSGIINPGLINPLNRFRPHLAQPINSNPIPIHTPINNMNYHIVNHSSPSYNPMIQNQMFNIFTGSPQQYFVQQPKPEFRQDSKLIINSQRTPFNGCKQSNKAQSNLNQYISKNTSSKKD